MAFLIFGLIFGILGGVKLSCIAYLFASALKCSWRLAVTILVVGTFGMCVLDPTFRQISMELGPIPIESFLLGLVATFCFVDRLIRKHKLLEGRDSSDDKRR